MLSTRIVSPDRRQNKCQVRLHAGGCRCVGAKYSQQCQSCHKIIQIGDCICHNISGWTHTECPIGSGEARGVRAIETGFNSRVDYGSSFLRRRITASEQVSLLLPRRLNFDDDPEEKICEDAKTPAAGGSKRAATATGVSPNESEDGSKQSDEPTNKKVKHEHGGDGEPAKGADIIFDDASAGGYAEEKRTKEQMAILSHEAEIGDVVAVSALAGCGKTTTTALLCNKIQEDHPWKTILYLVYNASMEKEAMSSNKFPKENMEIRTTHSFVLRHFFGVENMLKVNPTGEYKLKDIIEELDLSSDCKRIFPYLQGTRKRERVLERRVRTIAGYIRKTLDKFQASDKYRASADHVFYRAKASNTIRTKWREKINIKKYQDWAVEFFIAVKGKCMNIKHGSANGGDIDITFDGYLKVAQLENMSIPFDYMCIDEAQDMTDCQADLFWGQNQRADKRIYLFGDPYQQVYRFRGAGHSFRNMVDESNPKLTLTGSFRFGKNIAACATIVLQALGGEVLHGRSTDEGRVEVDSQEDDHSAMGRGVVLCRTQNGIYEYLYANRPTRWCYLGKQAKLPPPPVRWQLDLQTFIQGLQSDEGNDEGSDEGSTEPESSYFRYNGQHFNTLEEIDEYIDDEGDNELCKAVTLLKFLVSRGKTIDEFHSDLRASFHPLQDEESHDEYDGTVMTTVHKAKGLEFNCPVLVNDDFRFDAIRSAVLNLELHCDEANILYVAITRAKRILYLTEKAKNCLQQLSTLDRVKVQLPPMFTLDSSRKKLQGWHDEWALFKRRSDLIESPGDILYPPDWDNGEYPLALHSAMSVNEQRKQLWQFLRIYHPDKFLPRFRHRIQCDEVANEIKDTLEQITRNCTEILRSLRGDQDD